MYIKLPWEKIYGSPHFSEGYAFSQIREATGWLLSPVESQMPSTQNNPYLQWFIWG